MPFYEHVFLSRPELTTAKVNELVDKFTTVITENGGKITKREDWGLRTLAYKIQKNKKGYYTLLNIDAPSVAIKEMERLMRIDENVLRYLTIKVEELDDSISVMMESKNKKAKLEAEFEKDFETDSSLEIQTEDNDG